MAAEVVNNVDNIVYPQEMAEVTVEGVAHRPCAVGHHILDIARIEKTAHRAGQHSAVVLLISGLPLAVELHHIVCVALEEVAAILGLAIATVTGVFDNVDTFVENNERIGVGMAMIPRHTAFHCQHRGVLIPRIAHSGPAEVLPQMRGGKRGTCRRLLTARDIEEAHGEMAREALAMLSGTELVDIP